MNVKCVTALSVILFASSAACTQIAAKRICECMEENHLEVDLDECVENITELATEEGKNCRDAIKDFGDCLKSENCDSWECNYESQDVYQECDGANLTELRR